jgi:signal transduction histidine kinase
VIGAPLLVLGLLLTLTAFAGAGVRERDRGVVAGLILAPLHPATWSAFAAIIVGFWVELFAFSVIVGLFSTGASLLVVLVGFVFVGLGIEGARLVARVERARARWADPRPLLPHAYRPYGTGIRDLVAAVFFDLARWRDVVYVLIAFPLTLLELLVAVLLWGLSLGLLSVPLWYAMGAGVPFAVDGWPLSPAAIALAGGIAGVLLAPVAAVVTRGLMALHRAVVAGLLCVSEEQALVRRVQTLETSRRNVLDVEATELRRIERDLHDGAQQRLVMLTINLSLAAERIDTDPAAAKNLVVDARDQARLALAEIRDLVRGIAPAILLDRGLVPALSALAARSPVPTGVVSTLPDGARLPDSVERAAYFVVAEALANVAKHAGATRCEVRCRIEHGLLVVEIEDDGAGGAMLVPGGGLAGLAGRVEALDGRLAVRSPAGGPTLVRADIPVPAAAPGAIPGWGAGWGAPSPHAPTRAGTSTGQDSR